ncbi:unnamed protein product [Ophioblennius macclurei]
MFRGLGTWLGLESPTDSKNSDDTDELGEKKEEKVVEAQNEVNKQQDGKEEEEEEDRDKEKEKDRGLGDYIFSFASNATKKISESVVETAQTIKKTVEEGNIDGIIDKTFLGDFQKEQEKFVQEKKAKKSEAAVPPWVGYNEEETIQQQILALSADKRNFLRDPPAGVQFHFDMEHMYPMAAVMLEEDELLNRMRFDLVPKQVKEEVFWRNYFYRVSLVKQSAQLTALAAQQQEGEDRGKEVSAEDVIITDARPITPPVCIGDIQEPTQEEEEISAGLGLSEFISDDFDTVGINPDDLRNDLKQLLDPDDELSADDMSADWEKELLEEMENCGFITSKSQNEEELEMEKDMEEMLLSID